MSSFVSTDAQSSINLAKQVHLCNSRKKKAEKDAQLLLLVLFSSDFLFMHIQTNYFVSINILGIV